MSFDVRTELNFNRNYFINGKYPKIEPVEDQINRLRNEELLRKIDDHFSPSIAEFRNNYCMRDLKDSEGNTLLHKLVLFNRHVKYFNEALKDENLDINAKNNNGDTPFHIAVRLRSSKYVDLFKGLNAPSDIPNKRGITVTQMLRW